MICLLIFYFINKFVSITSIIQWCQRNESIPQTVCAVNVTHYMTYTVNNIFKYKQSNIAYVGLSEQKTCKMGKHFIKKLRPKEISPPSGKIIGVINEIFVPINNNISTKMVILILSLMIFFSRLHLVSKELTSVQSKFCTQKEIHLWTFKRLCSNDVKMGICSVCLRIN